MSIKKIVVVMAVLTVSIIGLQSCYKVATVPRGASSSTADLTKPVSFAKSIVPIFNANCALSGCHVSGGKEPDLAADKAYVSLVNGGYLDTGAPANSGIYLWITGKKNTPMPPAGPANPSGLNDLVLAWIQQGAQNN